MVVSFYLDLRCCLILLMFFLFFFLNSCGALGVLLWKMIPISNGSGEKISIGENCLYSTNILQCI